MIRCNLATILAEQNLKANKVSVDTGISRTTLTSLTSNRAQGIQFDTLNALCLYLKVKPDELISHIPVDIKINSVEVDFKHNTIVINMTISSWHGVHICGMCGELNVFFNDENNLSSLTVFVELWNPYDEETKEENDAIIKYFKSLPRPFLNDVQLEITERILDCFENKIDNVDVDFLWFEELF